MTVSLINNCPCPIPQWFESRTATPARQSRIVQDKKIEVFYSTAAQQNINAKKLFDVNQHSIDDLEAEQNGKTKEEIRSILYDLFKENDAEDHFNNYWEEN